MLQHCYLPAQAPPHFESSTYPELAEGILTVTRRLEGGMNCYGIVFIEGNIGVGKSSLLKNLATRHPTILGIKAPTHIWRGSQNIQNIEGKNLLKLFYEKKISAYALQDFIRETTKLWCKRKFAQWGNEHEAAPDFILFERSPESNSQVFRTELLNEEEYSIYSWVNGVRSNKGDRTIWFPTQQRTTIYLDGTIETQRKRIIRRDRAEECEYVTPAYLEKFQRKYDDFIKKRIQAENSTVIKIETEGKTELEILEEAEGFLTRIVEEAQRKRRELTNS